MLIFILMVVFLFSLLYKTTGISHNESSKDNDFNPYKDLNSFVTYMLICFRNALGMSIVPDYSKTWSVSVGTDPTLSYMMIAYSWILWAGNSVFLVLVIITFVISTIQKAYEEVNEHNFKVLYRTRCEFIIEGTLFKEVFKKRQDIETA